MADPKQRKQETPYSQKSECRDFTLFQALGINDVETVAWKNFVILRWGSLTTVSCPDCKKVDKHYFRSHRKQWRCKHCHRCFSVTTGTPFANRKIPFSKLIQLCYEFATSPKGISANSLAGKIGTTHVTAYLNISKIREAQFLTEDRSQLSGHIHVDGCHFCGKPRRPRKRNKMTSEIVNNHLKNRKANIVPGKKYNREPWNLRKLENRRIVMLLRQVSDVRGKGATRTISCVVMRESQEEVLKVIPKYVRQGSIISTDDGSAYKFLAGSYEHRSVCHSEEYSNDQGINNNQAESGHSRMRRAEYGVFHGMRPQYLAFYASEIAWRENIRKMPQSVKYQDLFSRIFSCGHSEAFRGYVQGRRLGYEHLG